MKIKTTVRYHFTTVRMANIQRQRTTNAGEGTEKGEPSYTAGGNVSWFNHVESSMEGPQKTKNRNTISPGNPPPRNLPKEYKFSDSKRHLHLFTAALFPIAKI